MLDFYLLHLFDDFFYELISVVYIIPTHETVIESQVTLGYVRLLAK